MVVQQCILMSINLSNYILFNIIMARGGYDDLVYLFLLQLYKTKSSSLQVRLFVLEVLGPCEGTLTATATRPARKEQLKP